MLKKGTLKSNFFKSFSRKDLKIFLIIFCLLVLRLLTISKNRVPENSLIRVSGKVSSLAFFEKEKRVVVHDAKIYLPSTTEVYLGDFLIVEGVYKKGRVDNPEIVFTKKSDNFLLVFRKKLLSFYAKALPSDAAGVVSGMVLGSKDLISFNLWQKFIKTGTAHVVVASGTNISFITKFSLSILFLYFSRRVALGIVFLFIWFYAVMTGFDPPIVRASLMASFVFWAEETGRLNSGIRIFINTAIIMLIFKPAWVNDVSFWLSVSSTLGLLILERPLRQKLKRVPNIFRESLSTSLAAFIAVFPISFYVFRSINIVSPLINSIILFTVPFITIIGFLAGIVGVLVYPIGRILILILYPLTGWFLGVINIFSNV